MGCCAPSVLLVCLHWTKDLVCVGPDQDSLDDRLPSLAFFWQDNDQLQGLIAYLALHCIHTSQIVQSKEAD